LFTHYWTPSIRHSFLATYGQIDGTTTSKALPFGAVGAYGDATVWNVGTQLAWLPVRNFEIGVEVLYARVEQDIRRGVVGTTGAFGVATTNPTTSSSYVTREKSGNFTGRMRVERTF
ncbi:MAG: porin, partial [Hyphomicrobiales bacterium]|nr:porin [Hyphomicrobiales bacterium]